MFTTLVSGLSFTECPRWHEGRLYFSDYFNHRVLAITPEGTMEVVAHVPRRPAGLGFLPDGTLLIAAMTERRVLRLAQRGELIEYADLSALAPGYINDMLVDHEGRAWVGNFGFDLYGGEPARTTALICIEPDGRPRIAADGLGFPNGMVITPDGTFIVAETMMNRLSAFTLRGGELGNRRTWAAFGPEPTASDVGSLLSQADVVPDGICLDAEGAVWVADITHARMLRVAEGGVILRELKLPREDDEQLLPFGCMLGGEDGRTLFVCAAPSYDEVECAAHHRACVLSARVDGARAGLP
jgi:sugar lactone lactonase YvrE